MPVPTPELGLSQAVDADDTADYLVTNLANSLVTMDALFNNVAGHTHGGVHQGGPITSIPASAIPLGSITSGMIADGTIQSADIAPGAITSANLSPPIDIPGMFRTHGSTGVATGTGPGLEIYYSGAQCVIQGFDRSTSLYMPVNILGTTITLSIAGGTNLLVDAGGNVTITSSLSVGGNVQVGANGYLFLTDTTHFLAASGANIAYAVPAGGSHIFEYNAGGSAPINCGPITTTTISGTVATLNSINIANGGSFDGAGSGYIRASSLTVTPGPFSAAATTINGNIGINGTAGISGTLTMGGDINLGVPRQISFGTGESVAPGENVSRPNTVYISPHCFIFSDLGVGHIVTCQSLVQTSDPRLKAGATVMLDTDCMARVRGPMPVYSYQLTPPDTDGDASSEPTPTPTDIGFMADDVQANSPEFVALDDEGAAVGVSYTNMAALLWGALRELDARCVAKGI